MSKQREWIRWWHGGERTRSYHFCCYTGAGTVPTSVCYTWKDIWLHTELRKETITACLDTVTQLHAEASQFCCSCAALLRQCATQKLTSPRELGACPGTQDLHTTPNDNPCSPRKTKKDTEWDKNMPAPHHFTSQPWLLLHKVDNLS